MEHPGVARAQASIDAFNAGDMTALSDFYADDVLWDVAGRHGLSGDHTGRADLMGYFERVREQTGGTLRLEPEAILASDTHTSMYVRVTGTRDGRSLDVTLAEALTVGLDGGGTSSGRSPRTRTPSTRSGTELRLGRKGGSDGKHPNAAKMREAAAKFVAGDLDGFMTTFSDDSCGAPAARAPSQV